MRNKRTAEGQELEANKTCLGGGLQPITGGGGIFKSAAVAVLQQERKLMTTGDITKVALERGLILSQGKTPEATMASALYTDVKRKAEKSAFTRPQEGLFGLRAWIEEGFFPDGWSGSVGAGGLAPFRKRNTAAKPRRPAGRAAKGRASASWQASEEREDEGSGVVDEHEYEDAEVGEGEPAATSEDAEDPAFKSPLPATRARGAGLATRAASSREASGGRNPNSGPESSQQQQQQQEQQPLQQEQQQQPHEGMLDLGGIGKTDLESPLHVLGDAALNTCGRVAAPVRLNTSGKRPRKRPAGLGIQVPEGSTNGTARMQDGAITPKSPYEDSLAALHEIATSPHPYAAVNGGSSEQHDRRCRPRLSTDADRGYAATAAAGQHEGPYVIHVPVLAPPRAAVPLLHPQSSIVQLQAMQGAQAWRPGGVNTMKGLISLMPLQSHPDEQLQGHGNAGDRTAEAALMQAIAERLEARLGRKNAQVGKAWMAVAQLHQCAGEEKGDVLMFQRACQAVKRAKEICLEAAQAVSTTCQCEAHFSDLQERLCSSRAGRDAAVGEQQAGCAGANVQAPESQISSQAGAKEVAGQPYPQRQDAGSLMPPPPPPVLHHVSAK